MQLFSNGEPTLAISLTLYSSRSEEWRTPQAFFDALDREFHFTLDPCATPENAKCRMFFTKWENGIDQPWGRHRVFCNPAQPTLESSGTRDHIRQQ
jgi:site-specific DNA-methyltransferase (adenine-specific)